MTAATDSSLAHLTPALLRDAWERAWTWQHYINSVVDENSDRFVSRWIAATFPAMADREFFQEYPARVNMLAISEDWCPDALEQLPAIAKMAGANSSPASKHPFNLAMRILARDENPALMNLVLTGGARSIPKLIFMDDAFKAFALWGPRPAACQGLLHENRGKLPAEEIQRRIAAWYLENGSAPLFREIRAILDEHAIRHAGMGAPAVSVSDDIQSGMPAQFDPLKGFTTEICNLETFPDHE